MVEARERSEFLWRAWRAVLLGALVIVAGLLLWRASDIFLLLFVSVLFGILIRGLANLIAHHTPISIRWALTAVIAVLLGLMAAGTWLIVPKAATQLQQFADVVPSIIAHTREWLSHSDWGRFILERFQKSGEQPGLVDRLATLLNSVLGALSYTIVVLFLGIYFATQPKLYVEGLVRLAPVHYRPRFREVLHEVGDTLLHWLLGEAASSIVIGTLVFIGLKLLDLPQAMMLALFAAAVNFIPYVGAFASSVPAMLLALPDGPWKVLMVIVLYTVVQNLEGYLITPLIQRRAVRLPPALTITALVLMGVVAGPLGVMIATPLAAATMVLVRLVYVEDVLEKSHLVSAEAAEEERPEDDRAPLH